MAELIMSGLTDAMVNTAKGPIGTAFNAGMFESPEVDEALLPAEQGAMGLQDNGDAVSGPA